MNKKYIMVSLDDEKLGILAEVLSNKTAKKILEYLADKEASEAEIAKDLGLPANTVNYNIKKLSESGLIEKAKEFFWSVKGKKILRYRVAKKSILISPKRSFSGAGILSVLAITAVGALVVKISTPNNYFAKTAADSFSNNLASNAGVASSGAAEGAKIAASPVIQNSINTASQMPELWAWFLAGGIFTLIIYMILNWKKFD